MFSKKSGFLGTIGLTLLIILGAVFAIQSQSIGIGATSGGGEIYENCEDLRDSILIPYRIDKKRGLFAGSALQPYDEDDWEDLPHAIAVMGIMLPPDERGPIRNVPIYSYRSWAVQAIAFDRDTNEVIYDKYTIHIDFKGPLRVGGDYRVKSDDTMYGEKTYVVEYGKPQFEYKTKIWLPGGEDWMNDIWVTADGYKDSSVFTHTVADSSMNQNCDLATPFVILEFYLDKED